MASLESSRQSDIARSLALLDRYGFDTKGYMSTELVARWLEKYEPHWIRLAAVEALYQGRYKVISVEQILTLWERRGQPTPHFSSDFERLISRKLPDYFPAYPQIEHLQENAIAEGEKSSSIQPFGLFSRIELRKSTGIRSWQLDRETIPSKIKRLSERPSPSSTLPSTPSALMLIRAHAGLSRIFAILESDLFIAPPQLALPPVLSAEMALLLEAETPENEWVIELDPPEKCPVMTEEGDREKIPSEKNEHLTDELSLDELETLDLLDELEKIDLDPEKIPQQGTHDRKTHLQDRKKTSKKIKSPILPNPDPEKLYFFRSNIITFTPDKTNPYFFNKLKLFNQITLDAIANPELELNL
ncbi:MAG: hypothetical protein J7647_25825 [Cyanobacteria bacterium SBLK]|nr:hypothetical protein [Cyanobacteria bacterium SBLK]